MKLYGSTTSPFVRRIRLWLADMPVEFVSMEIFAGEGRELLKSKNPALKVPMLEDGDLTLYDSRVIYRYLQQKFSTPALSWEQENQLTLIDAVNDTFVQLMMAKRSAIPADPKALFFQLHFERVETVMLALNEQAEEGLFDLWDYPAICLYCLIDWTIFRELLDIEKYPTLRTFWQSHQTTNYVVQTDPRG